MKLKQSVLIIMATALPVVSFAASEVIPVTQDTVNVHLLLQFLVSVF